MELCAGMVIFSAPVTVVVVAPAKSRLFASCNSNVGVTAMSPVQNTLNASERGERGGVEITGTAATGQATTIVAVLLFALPQLLVAFAQYLNVPAVWNGPGSYTADVALAMGFVASPDSPSYHWKVIGVSPVAETCRSAF